MSYDPIEKVFRRTELFTKEDVLQSLDLTIEYIENEDEACYSDETRKKKLELCYKFRKKLEKCKLPILKDDWWCYKYEFTGDGIDLFLCSYSNIELDENEEYIDSLDIEEEHKILEVKCDYLTVDQYAKMQGVSPITVRQWIRRGKLRYAKKNGRDWLIPIIEDKPSRGYVGVHYSWGKLPQSIKEEFPFLTMCTSILIYQDEKDKLKYICKLENFKSNVFLNVNLTRKEVEKLELALISSNEVIVDAIKAQYVPFIDRE